MIFIEFKSYFKDIKGVYIAGGSLRDWYLGKEPTKDIDIYFRNSEALDHVRLILKIKGYSLTYECPQGHFSDWKKEGCFPVQLITKTFYSTLANCLDDMNWTVCQFGWNAEDNTYLQGPMAVQDLKAKQLRVHRINYPRAALQHMVKYIQYGYTPCPGFYHYLHEAIRNKIGHPEEYLYRFD